MSIGELVLSLVLAAVSWLWTDERSGHAETRTKLEQATKTLESCGRDKVELARLAKVAAEDYQRGKEQSERIYERYRRAIPEIMGKSSNPCDISPAGSWFGDFLDLQDRSLDALEQAGVVQPRAEPDDGIEITREIPTTIRANRARSEGVPNGENMATGELGNQSDP